ncbi:MAG TPA: kinase, partial [Methanomassiliicoccales archaeon]|nr:kinase [Methanomassiliicoccales archaeon]
TFGDAVLDDRLGFGICSGDQLIERLAKTFMPSRIVFCADVDGVYDADPKQHDDAAFLEAVDASTVRRLKEETSYVDVTGGMVGKLRAMMRMSDLGAEIMVINGFAEGRLKAALKGERVIASRVVGRKG